MKKAVGRPTAFFIDIMRAASCRQVRPGHKWSVHIGLLDLTAAGYPVIPTVDAKEHIGQLSDAPKYVIKPKDGADSIGLEFLTREELEARELKPGTTLIQPILFDKSEFWG